MRNIANQFQRLRCVYVFNLMPNKELVTPSSREKMVYCVEMKETEYMAAALDNKVTNMKALNDHSIYAHTLIL